VITAVVLYDERKGSIYGKRPCQFRTRAQIPLSPLKAMHTVCAED
jgi:hypothetical protein